MAAYGRLDIHEPTGAVKTYRLTSEVTTVGRAAGNAIVIDDPSVADQHCRLQLLDDTVHISNLDARAGIVFSGARLRDSLPRPLRDLTRFTIGNTQIVFYPSGDQPTLPMRSISESTRPINASLRVDLETSLLDVYPASSSSLEIALSNRSHQEKTVAIEVDGLPENWAKLSQSAARLDSGDTAFIMLTVAPPRRADIKPGDYPATIAVRPRNNHDADVLLGLLVRLHGFGGLSLALEPDIVRHNKSLQLFLLNQGNEELRLALSARDPSAQLDIDLSEPGLLLAPGQRRRVACRVAARSRPLLGKSRKIPFALLVQADNDCAYQAAIPATALVKPRLSARNLGAALVLLAAVALALITFLTRTPPPEINAFALSEPQVARGTPVELTWQAAFAERYVIEIDRVAIAELGADADAFALSTDGYADPIEVALIAIAGQATAIEKRQLDIYQSTVIRHFEADRRQMLRRVEADLTLTWRLEGAVSTDLRYPSGFSIVSEQTTDDGAGKLILRGLPEADFDLILSARDEMGNQTEGRINVKTADPECRPLRDLPLYAGPDERYNQTNLALHDVPVLVLGRAPSSDWLLVELANGDTGWGGLDAFFCAAFDPTALLVITDLPPLPTASPTSTPEPAPSLTPTAVTATDTSPGAAAAATALATES